MKATYSINITIELDGPTEQACDRAAHYYKDVFRAKLHNQLKSKKMYKDLLKYEVDLPNIVSTEQV